MNRSFQTDKLLVLALLLTMLVFFFTSCCPKITEINTTKVDTLVVYSTDTVTITEVDTFRTEFNIDSLLNILNKPINQNLSSSTTRGVTTRLSVRDGRIVCEATIDSLQAVIDSVRSTVVTVTNTNTVTKIVKAPPTWREKLYKWTFWLLFALGLGFVIAKTQTFWTPYVPFLRK